MADFVLLPGDAAVSLHARLWPTASSTLGDGQLSEGVFLGERHLYFTPQPDDVLCGDSRWDP